MYKLVFVTITILFISCTGSDKPDVSKINVDVKLERFEQDFFNMDSTQVDAGLNALQMKYPEFLPFFIQQILQLNPGDPQTPSVVSQIISAYSPIHDSIQAKYGSLTWLENDLEQAFKYVKHYYPNYNVPGIITYIATFDAPGVVVTPKHLGIGLHQYAGKNFSAYRVESIQQMYPAYISRRFDKEYIVPNAMKAVADDIYPDASVGRPLIEQMIEKGKHWFLLDRFLPDAQDSVKTGFTHKQLNWVNSNEGNIWAYITKNENIYTIEPPVIQNYLGESPFTQGMPEEYAPGNLGQWIGWRIVEQFAAKNRLSVQEVLQTAPQQIFEGAAYRPK